METKNTDLILLDYEMPGENGKVVLEKIRKMPFGANTPVVFLSGVRDANIIQQNVLLKPSGYLLKPVSKVQLLGKIKEILS